MDSTVLSAWTRAPLSTFEFLGGTAKKAGSLHSQSWNSASTLQTTATHGSGSEKLMKIAGIVLIIAGVIALVYGGFSYTTTKKAVDMGPLQINTKQNHSVPLPPVLGVIAIVGGGALLYFGAKKA
jgi:uncharacterized membrane protein YidH (DUF202 family)